MTAFINSDMPISSFMNSGMSKFEHEIANTVRPIGGRDLSR